MMPNTQNQNVVDDRPLRSAEWFAREGTGACPPAQLQRIIKRPNPR
jgi:hypothetical protein